MRRQLLLGLLVILCTSPAVAARLRVEKAGKQTFLVEGKERVLLWTEGGPEDTPPLTTAKVAGGYTISLEPGNQLAVVRAGQPAGRIDYARTMRDWLDQDDLWGGHKRANDLRFLLRADTAGPLSVITDLTPAGPSALAVATWRSGGSGYPIVAQFLVRVRVTPAPALEPLRELDLPDPWSRSIITSWDRYLYRAPGPRLFRAGKVLLLYAKPGSYNGGPPGAHSELLQLAPDGRKERLFATFPAHFEPEGMVAGRWLVLAQAAAGPLPAQPVWLLDATTRRLQPLPGKWKSRGEGIRVTVPASSQRIAVARTLSRPAPRRAAPGAESEISDLVYVVLVPSGKTVVLPDASNARPRFWKSYVITYSSEGTAVNVYHASSGKLLARLPLEKRAIT